jgi:RNA polymerase sigma factor (TIGR02999 family)
VHSPDHSRQVESDLTQLIHLAQSGDRDAADALYASAYTDLRRLARSRLRAGGRYTLLDTCSLVHESYVRFVKGGNLSLQDRLHFMRWAAQVMRSVIVDFARRRVAARRGGGSARVTFDIELAATAANGEDEILSVHQALERIGAVDERMMQVVEMRYFGGLTEPEIAVALGVTERTVRRDWHKARLLLREALG